jgi:hypothetical protein
MALGGHQTLTAAQEQDLLAAEYEQAADPAVRPGEPEHQEAQGVTRILARYAGSLA